jgi:hypothetical protein
MMERHVRHVGRDAHAHNCTHIHHDSHNCPDETSPGYNGYNYE